MLYRCFYVRTNNATCLSTKDIESYLLREDELKILRARYDPINGEFLGIENFLALITVRNDPQEQFFDYGYNKENAKVLLSTKKLKIPKSFKTTIFGQHRLQYERGVFDEQKHYNLFICLLLWTGMKKQTSTLAL